VLTILSNDKRFSRNNNVLVSGSDYLRFKDIKTVEGFLGDIVKTEKSLAWPEDKGFARFY
jgi:hypothetical protein